MTTREREAQIDQLLHDAEHAEGGADFARMMASRDPAGPHESYAIRLYAKAGRLRSGASHLRSHLLDTCDCGDSHEDIFACASSEEGLPEVPSC